MIIFILLQNQIYRECCDNIVQKVLNGNNASFITLGAVSDVNYILQVSMINFGTTFFEYFYTIHL